MYIADIIPFAFIPRSQPQVFSYFLPRELTQGALVEIPVGRRMVQGVVMATRPVSESKLEIRKGDFAIKSIKKILSDTRVYQREQLELANWISEKCWAPLGKVLGLMVQMNDSRLTIHDLLESETPQPIFVQATDRFPAYLSRITKTLSLNKHILFLCPDGYAVKDIAKKLAESGFSDTVAAYTGAKTKKTTKNILERLAKTEPLIIVGTRSALFLPLANLDTVIIEAMGSSSYDAWGRTPKYNAVEVAEKLAQLHGAQLMYGDLLPTVEIWEKINRKKIAALSASEFSAQRQIPSNDYPVVFVIDLRYEKYWSSRHQLTTPLKDALRRAMRGDRLFEPSAYPSTRKQAIIFINRRGVATALVCRACGLVPKCQNCDAAMVLHEAKTFSPTVAGVLRCHHCGYAEEPPKQCMQCKSYRMWPIGAGTVQVERDVKKLLPEARILRLDSDSIKNEKELEKKLTAFKNKEFDILTGTQLLLKEPLLPDVAVTAVLGTESFFVFPEYKANERAWRILETLRRKTTEHMLVQTLNPDMPVLQHFIHREQETLLNEERKTRKTFGYPPFGELIKLSYAHRDRGHAHYAANALAKELEIRNKELGLEMQMLGPSPAFIPRERGKWKFVILLKLGLVPERTELLTLIPPGWQVEINPRELL